MIDVKDLKFDEKTTQEFTAKNLNVLVFINSKNGKKLYLKPSKKNGEFIELIPLSKEELSDVGIIEESISETYNDGLFDMDDIQESISDSEPIQQITKFNTADSASMRLAKKMAEEQLRKLEGKNQDDSGLEAAKEILKDAQENLSVELTALGVDTNPQDLRTKTDIDRAVSTVKKMRELKQEINAKTSQTVPSGTVPLSSQTPAKTQSEGFGSTEEMIDNVNLPQNKDVRNKLLHKCLSGVIQGKLSLPSYQPEQPETTTSDLSPDLKLSKRPDVLGIQHSFRKKKLMERAKKGDSEALAVLNSEDF